MRTRKLIVSIVMLLGIWGFGQTKLTLLYFGNKETIRKSVDEANRLLQNPSFYAEIEKYENFKNSILSGKEIAQKIKNATQKIEIKTYRYKNPFNPFNCVNAETKSSVKIKVNLWCFSSELKNGVNTLIHETIHAVDNLDSESDFDHEKNNNNDHSQDNTAPWKIGKIAENFINNQN